MKLASASLILASAMATHGQLVAPDAKGLHLALPKTGGDADGPLFTHDKSAPSYVNGKILASYTSAESLKLINEHVNSNASFLGEGNVELNRVSKFSRPQQANGGGVDADGGSGGPSSIESNVPILGYVVIKTDESNVRHEMGELASIPGVKHVERDLVMHLDSNSKMSAGASDGDGDRHGRRLQGETRPWGIDMVNVTHLWEIEPKSHIKICVVDTGYDLGHVDLPTEDVTGWNPTSGAGAWDVDGNGHGSHVAGTIGAIGGNDEGVVGVNPDPTRFSFHIAKACSDDGVCRDTLDAVESCVDAGANIISMSLGSPSFSEIWELVFQDVYDRDILVIASAGNSGSDAIEYPAAYKTVVSVASVAEGGGEDSDTYGELSSFSTRNDQTEIAAPGSNVLSTIPGNMYASYSGTSMACPHVSGIAALLWSHFPDCKNNQIRNAMIHVDSVREPPITDDRNTAGWDKFYGWGIVNAGLAYELLRTMGCEGAGGTYSDHLSDMASGGSQQKSLGCVNDEQCFDANVCLGQMKCNVVDNTCYSAQETVPDCDDGSSCTDNVCTPLREIVDGKNYMCTNPDKCGNGFSCDDDGDQQCVCTDNIVQVYVYTHSTPQDVYYALQNQCTQPPRIEFEYFAPNNRNPNTWYQDQYCFPDTQILFGINGSLYPFYIGVYNNVPVYPFGQDDNFQYTFFGTCPPPTGAPTDVPTDAPTDVPTSSPTIPSPTASPIASKSGKGSKATGTSSKSGKVSVASVDGEAVYVEDGYGSMSMLVGYTGSMPMHVKKEGEFGRRE